MTTAEPPKAPVPSFLLNLALGVIAILPAIPAPTADWPSIDTPVGRAIYVASLVLTVSAIVQASRREEKRTVWESTQREAAAEARHEATLRGQREESERVIAFMKELGYARAGVAQTGPIGAPLLSAIDASGSLVTRVYADRQRYLAAATAMHGHAGPVDAGPQLGPQGPTAAIGPMGASALEGLPNATALLHQIAQNPPTQSDAVQEAAARLRGYVMKTEVGEFVTAADEVRFIHRDATGKILGEG